MNRSNVSSVIVSGLILAVAGVLLFTSLSEPRAEQRGDVAIEQANSPAQAVDATDPLALMNTYCASCHGPEKQKGKVRFDQLAEMSAADRDELLNLAHEVIHFKEMPPSDEPQPTEAEREALLAYLSGQAGEEVSAALADKLRYPGYGNLVDHEKLFSGEIDEPAFTYSRRWLVSPEVFNIRVMDVFELEGRERAQRELHGFHGVTNPFVLPDTSGVRDYDTRLLTGGHLIVMLGNAQWIAEKQVFGAQNHRKPNNEIVFPNRSDTWYPGNFAPESFKAILDASAMPSDEQMRAAIDKQFSLALRRAPSDTEMQKYLAFTRSMIEMGGNAEGLKQMLQAVLLEADFLYRVEFGGGEADEHGRIKLTPHEAAHAIAYSLGDMGPDDQLLEAAAQGRLSTKEDYRREVQRLLADDDYFRGVIDGRIFGTSAKSIEVSHPKLVRFFREFFGYPMALSIFKDAERIEGNYINAGRGTNGTPGALVNEADQIVAWHVENDRRVFENLLASDKYFVYYRDDPERDKAIIAEWREVWEKLKDTPWETKPKEVFAEYKEYFESLKWTEMRDNRRRKGHQSLLGTMRFFSQYFPHGKQPFPSFPWAHGNQQRHAALYSLPATPNGYHYLRYWNRLSPEQKAAEVWDYPIEQPFSIPNRKGILSHPAWLIAHAHNFHTDPIKRGLWIQEKLLANRVPDVPITVDAKIPDHPDKTLRTRLTEKTIADECWRCHKHMNPLGLPFEMYDDFGRFRTEEMIEYPENIIKEGDGTASFHVYKTLPIDTTGTLAGTGESSLDGEVKDALDLIDRLAKSDRVRQSIIRHAFRFFMGRNEMLSDSQTLIDMERAYIESDGSFNAVIVSLLTSDSFMYRKEVKD